MKKAKIGVSGIYVLFGSFICLWFASASLSGGKMIEFGETRPNKPMGPGQHYHK